MWKLDPGLRFAYVGIPCKEHLFCFSIFLLMLCEYLGISYVHAAHVSVIHPTMVHASMIHTSVIHIHVTVMYVGSKRLDLGITRYNQGDWCLWRMLWR